MADVLFELLRFPSGVHDDRVDGIAWIGQMVESFSHLVKPAPPKEKTWRDKLRTMLNNGVSNNSAMSA
jgi:hypothetical protein